MIMSEPFIAPNDWFVYGHLHAILAVPTLAILAIAPPLTEASKLYKQAAYGFIGFIVCIGVAQSFIWDSYGATNGFWEFNDAKCTLTEDAPLPLEEVLWLFHHVTKTALYQLKAFELIDANADASEPSTELKASVGVALAALSAFGWWALTVSPDESVKCIGLVAAFFAPVWLIIWLIGSNFVKRHRDRITWGWFAPGITTVLIDCLGQQQGVWRFPDPFLSGIGVGYLKLDIVLVYMVSTFAVTGTGAVILAATEEITARRAELGLPPPESLVDVAKYILDQLRTGRLDVSKEAAV